MSASPHPRKVPARSGGRRTSRPGFTDTFTSCYLDTGQLRLHAVTGDEGPPLLLAALTAFIGPLPGRTSRMNAAQPATDGRVF
jgi:hypothetical protein